MRGLYAAGITSNGASHHAGRGIGLEGSRTMLCWMHNVLHGRPLGLGSGDVAMKVLLVHYNPARGGGAESSVKDLSQALELRGHEVIVEFTNPRRAWRAFKPDVVHYHTLMEFGPLQWAQEQRVPHCLSLHDYWPFCSGRMLLKHYDEPCSAVQGVCDGDCDGKPADGRIRDLVNGTPVVAFNPYSAAIYRRHGIRVDTVIPHGIDTDFFVPNLAKRDGKVRVVTVSAWPTFPTKGMHILREALKGTGVEARMVAGVSRARVREILQKAAVFVFPSCYEETWGLCLTEAMACGCACVASDVCGPRTQIEESGAGVLVPPRDAAALREAILTFLTDGYRRDCAGRMARRWAAEEANLAKMGQRYKDFYQTLL